MAFGFKLTNGSISFRQAAAASQVRVSDSLLADCMKLYFITLSEMYILLYFLMFLVKLECGMQESHLDLTLIQI